MQELESFRWDLTNFGNVTFEHGTRDGHADLAIACMLSWWHADAVRKGRTLA